MASINYATREISCKIVYYGPGLSGKTTNLQIIHRKIPDKDKSEMVSLATETDRTLFFDFLPLDLGSIKGFSTKFQLYTVPGQVYYNATRKLVLRGVDGVVFVVDSQVDKLQENLESFANLQENLREYGHSIENIPLVLQYNKRDLPNVYPIDQLNSLVNKNQLPYYEAVAATGVGVFTTLKAIGKSVIDKFNAKYAGFQGTRRPTRPDAPPAPTQAPRPAQQPAFGQNPPPGMPQRPAAQPFPGGGFGNAPQPGPLGGQGAGAPAPGQRTPLNVPAPGGFSTPQNPFGGNATGFPGQPATPPRPPQAAPILGPSPTQGGGNPGFGGGNPGGFGAPPTGFPGFGTSGQNPFGSPMPGSPNPGVGNPPSFGAPAGSGSAPSGFPAAFPPTGLQGFPFASGKPGGPGPGGPGQIPQQPMGNPGFSASPNIPVSPFVESFTAGKPIAPNPPLGIPGMGPPMNNPFSGGGLPPAGQNRPMPSLGGPGPMGNPPGRPMGNPGGAPMGGGFPGFPGMPGGNPLAPKQDMPGGQQGFGQPGGQFGSLPGNSPGPAYQPSQKSASPFPTLPPNPPPARPLPDLSEGANPPPGKSLGGIGDNSGIVTTYEDMAKDDSFKTRKLPHPGEKKKGFFDGLFKKEK